MAELLLSTKFFIPPARPDLVTRPRLMISLNNCLRLPLAIISAPPGFGKTTMLAAWVAAQREEGGKPAAGAIQVSPPAVAWVSLDPDDNDLARFWTYAIAALQKTIVSGLGESPVLSDLVEVQGLLAVTPPPFQVFLTLLINAIAAQPRTVVLILDDYHVIQDPGISESVAFLVDHCPANLHLVIASRSDPPLPLGRWRGRGQLLNLRAQDLRFSLEEALAFLNGSMGLSLSPDNVAELDQRTEGWVAGLQMAAFALQEKDDSGVTRAIQAFTGRHHILLDYFTDEILHRQSAEIQFFLLSTSVLERMCADLCAAVIGTAESSGRSAAAPAQAQAMLEYLEHANLFVVPLDPERRWYRYHHLFHDLLLARLRQTSGQAGEAELRQRAARWHTSQGQLTEAISQAILAQDYELAADLLESPAQSVRIFESGGVSAILKWTQALPPAVINRRLWLKLYQSRSLFYTGKTGTAEAVLDEIEREISAREGRGDLRQEPQKEMLLGAVLSHKARYASVRGQVSLAREIATKALEHIPPDEVGARSFIRPTLALSALRMGDVEEAGRLFEESVYITRRAGGRFQTTGGLANLGVTWVIQGKLREVIRLESEAIQEGMIQSISLPESGWLRYPLAEALYEQNALDAAERTLADGLKLVSEGKLTDYFGLMPALLARIQHARGRADEAQSTMDAALASARQTTVAYYMSEIEAYQTRLWLESGELDRALGWAEAFQRKQTSEYLCEIEQITLGETFYATGRPDLSSRLLRPLAEDAQARGRAGREIYIRLILALCCHRLGDRAGANRALERAVRLGEPEGYVRPFLHLGVQMANLIQQFADQEEAFAGQDGRNGRQYLRTLLGAYPHQEPSIQRKGSQHPQLAESLTPREMDVLRLLAEGLSNREIAGRLFLSPNTLRVYTTNLYAKLDVHNRTQAVARARVLRIL